MESGSVANKGLWLDFTLPKDFLYANLDRWLKISHHAAPSADAPI
jgi:hypothetical protein